MIGAAGGRVNLSQGSYLPLGEAARRASESWEYGLPVARCVRGCVESSLEDIDALAGRAAIDAGYLRLRLNGMGALERARPILEKWGW